MNKLDIFKLYENTGVKIYTSNCYNSMIIVIIFPTNDYIVLNPIYNGNNINGIYLNQKEVFIDTDDIDKYEYKLSFIDKIYILSRYIKFLFNY